MKSKPPSESLREDLKASEGRQQEALKAMEARQREETRELRSDVKALGEKVDRLVESPPTGAAVLEKGPKPVSCPMKSQC